jgi:hypothetical protein
MSMVCLVMQEGRWETCVVPNAPERPGVICYHGILNGNGCQSKQQHTSAGLPVRQLEELRPVAQRLHAAPRWRRGRQPAVQLVLSIRGARGFFRRQLRHRTRTPSKQRPARQGTYHFDSRAVPQLPFTNALISPPQPSAGRSPHLLANAPIISDRFAFCYVALNGRWTGRAGDLGTRARSVYSNHLQKNRLQMRSGSCGTYIVEIEHIRPKIKTPLASLPSFDFGPSMLYF